MSKRVDIIINNDTAKTTKVSELYLGFQKMVLLYLTNDAK